MIVLRDVICADRRPVPQEEAAVIHGLRKKVIIQPGGLIEIRSSELPQGEVADVIVILEPASGEPHVLSSYIGAGKGSFATPEEVDRFLRKERDSWES